MALQQTTKATVSTTKDIVLKPQVLRKLRLELKTYTSLKEQFDILKAQLDKRKGVIGRLREETGEQSLSLDGYKITRVCGTSSKIDKAKLVELGCAMAWITESTVVTPKKPYEKITLPGEKDEEY